MAKGVLYCMTTVVPGLIKIGKTTKENYESRMYSLERNGYSNVAGLKRYFAIEVEDYDEKETMLDEIFSKSQVPNTELFALDIDLVVQLLSSFDGNQVFPEKESKKKVFEKATKDRQVKVDLSKIPDGKYHISTTKKGFGKIKGTMRVENGIFIVEKGSTCVPSKADWLPEARRSAIIKNDILQEEVECNSPSTAGWIVLGHSNNGWSIWQNEEGQFIDIYRQK
ncbi:MAG: DUF4357 domain-containing protein [Clostridiales bacterium]|nr:DUF4357 domain-containing protein [Clostridiales bacterium]